MIDILLTDIKMMIRKKGRVRMGNSKDGDWGWVHGRLRECVRLKSAEQGECGEKIVGERGQDT
jgi:hypothetical protein